METKITAVSPVPVEKNSTEAPLYNTRSAAGFGVPGDDTVDETLNIHDLLVKNPTATFFVRVAGDSMEGAKIFDGDILVVDRSVPAKHGSIVIAAVNGELVVKRLQQKAAGACLISENDNYAPIQLTESDDCFIWGVVTGTARKLT